ncbi:hypothetical protein F5884DRAFT_260888 [Xylogone sp. PMI_703]|nr:hypothetical protein F5884DRAFT_260888 [Xylogone sp. PMI_703]
MHRLLWVFVSILATASAFIPSECMKAIASLEGRFTSLSKSYQTEICAKGCKPSVDDWDEWTYQHAFLPFVDSVTTEMGLSEKFHNTWVQLGKDLAANVKKDCASLLEDTHFCANPDTLEQWGKCFKRNFLVLSAKNALKVFPLVTSELCKADYMYLTRDHLWQEVLPGYMKEYAATCDTEQDVDQDTMETNTEPSRPEHDREL